MGEKPRVVIKRDESKEPYNFEKIQNAVIKAFSGCGQEVTPSILSKLSKYFENVFKDNERDEIEVDEIHNKVEQFLMKNNFFEVSRSYILKRYQKALKKTENERLTKGISEKLMASNVENQNANVDEKSFGGRIGEASRFVIKDYALNYCMSKRSKNNHLNNEIYLHDLDSYAVGMHNCLSIPFDDLLAKGFNTRQVDIRPARSINTAFQLVAVIFQIQSLQQFGGVSATHLDWTMVPYVRLSFFKHYLIQYLKDTNEFDKLDLVSLSEDDLDDWIEENKSHYLEQLGLKEEDFKFSNKDKLDPHLYQCALFDTRRELYQASEGLYHNLNSLQSRSGNQLPFTSINYGTNTEPEGQLVIKALLECSIKGVGKHHKTPIFPCGIFQYKKGVNDKPGTPNYSLYRLALQSTSKRLYPNYANVDWSGNAGYDPEDPRTYFSTMGCHAYDTPIIMSDGSYKMVQDIKVGDKIMGINSIPRTVQSLIRGNDKLFRINQGNGESYIVNEGHILSLMYWDTKNYNGLTKGDKINITVHDFLELPDSIKKCFRGYTESYELPEKDYDISPYLIGLGISRGSVNSTKISDIDVIPDGATVEDGFLVLDKETETKFEQFLSEYDSLEHKSIPEEYLQGSKRQRKELLLGLAYFTFSNYDETKTLIFTEVDLKQVKKLANSVGYNSIYLEDTDYLGIKGFSLDSDSTTPTLSTIRIEEADTGDFYGFELDGDKLYLINDCTVTHNCRTANGWDINGFGQLKDGRGNICPVTIILPTLAMEAGRNTEKFMRLLGRKIEEAKDMLIERFEWICSQSPKSAEFMYENGTMAGYVPEEGIRSALKHGTLALGQLGLAEALQLLIGTDQTTEEGLKLAKRIESLFKKRCSEYKEEYKLNFGVYFTPSENLCHTALKKFTEKYGIIPNVSDKKFFTNSMHVPVWKEIDPFEKINIESQLTGYSSAGCITYVELPSTCKHNIDALETLVNYAMDHDIPYFAVNVPNDTCNNCGYTDEIGETCPECGSSDIKRLRRVTGYLTGDYLSAFNEGKQDEVQHRVKHITG